MVPELAEMIEVVTSRHRSRDRNIRIVPAARDFSLRKLRTSACKEGGDLSRGKAVYHARGRKCNYFYYRYRQGYTTCSVKLWQ
jgi:hypothetical protein